MKSEPATVGASLATPLPELIAATSASLPVEADAKARARTFAEPLIAGETLDTGENTLAHADAVARILADIGGSEAMQAASYLCTPASTESAIGGHHQGLWSPTTPHSR